MVPPSTGGLEGGQSSRVSLAPIESIHPGDFVLAHDSQPHRVIRLIKKPYQGLMIGLKHSLSPDPLWLTANHRVLAKLRPRTLGGQRNWSASPPTHLERRRQLRREASPMERELWSVLVGGATGYKFRRQHPIGPYIADFYSRQAHLVVEVDGSTHFTPEGLAYDAERDAYLRALGLDILRFTASEVMENLEGVFLAIHNQCTIRVESRDGAQWVQAAKLLPGDLVFYGPDLESVALDSVEQEHSREEVYDLEVEEAHSFLTEVCAVHNCGSGTTAFVAEKWGRRWLTIDTSRAALARPAPASWRPGIPFISWPILLKASRKRRKPAASCRRPGLLVS